MMAKVLLLSLFLALVIGKQVCVSYTDKQQVALGKYFFDLSRQFFVDLGATHPIHQSKSIMLRDWRGLNVEADQNLFHNFLYSRAHQINLNLAVNDKSGNTEVDGKKVFAFSLADLCHKYFLKTPKVININLGEVEKILSGNDWKNPLCIPETILVSTAKNTPSAIGALNANGYDLIEKTEVNSLYVLKTKKDDYSRKAQEGDNKLKAKKSVAFSKLIKEIFAAIDAKAPASFSYQDINPKTSPVYIHFSKERAISIPDIQKYQNFITQKQDPRPILIMHYNPLLTKIYLGSEYFSVKKVQVGEETLFKIIASYGEGSNKLLKEIFIFDHQINPAEGIVIIDEKKGSIDCKRQVIIKEKIIDVEDDEPSKP